MTTISGTVLYRERVALSREAQITVRLLDAHLTDAPAATVAETTFAAADRQVPFPFALCYDPDAIDAGRRYQLDADIVDAAGTWRTTVAYPVRASADPTERVDLVLVRTV